jgi:alpha-mannosidase
MRKWKVYLLHHTHFDIGYTHTQEDVFKIQMRNLEEALALVEQNKHRTESARFRWSPEVTFNVMKWLGRASQPEIERFVEMVRDGYIGLDGFYAGMLTGLCRPEELAQVFAQKSQLERLTGVAIDSAMITDIPGWNWGLVTVLAESGIKYLSSGPNGGDRIGYTLTDWGDKPFYWVSPSGKERVLLWVHGKGYAWFHTDFDYEKKIKNKLTPGRIRRYLCALERSGYPYDSIIIRYTIGADNGPADKQLSQIVEDWNASIDDIKLVISTTSKAMAEFEADHGKQIPEYRGDFTPYWEDGAFSTSRETAIAREASEHLTQAQTLAVLTGAQTDRELESRAWENVLLFNEHTWGAHNSISRPDHPFAQSQWVWKRERAIRADVDVRGLLKAAASGDIEAARFYVDELSPATQLVSEDQQVTVYNTHSWSVSRVVEVNNLRDRVLDSDDTPMPSQRLSNGRLAFYAKDLPPMGSRQYRFVDGAPAQVENGCRVENFQLSSDQVTVKVDAQTGAIQSFICAGVEYVNQNSADRFNGYVLVPGKMPLLAQREHSADGVKIEILDSGPLRCTIRVSRKVARTLAYTSEISLDAFSNEVRINNVLDRPVSRWKEGIHFSYPFNLPQGAVRYDCAWGTVKLDADQLAGANRNFITASRWVDVSDERAGMCCTLLDAPIFKSGPLTRDPWRWGPPKLCGWLTDTTCNGTIYSYVMNNYWQTNYKADQPGKTLFRYVFRPHGKFSPVENYRAALEHAQPPLLTFGGKITVTKIPMPVHEDVVISSMDISEGKLQMRFFNAGDTDLETALVFENTELQSSQLQIVSAGKSNNLVGNQLKLAASETLLVAISHQELSSKMRIDEMNHRSEEC